MTFSRPHPGHRRYLPFLLGRRSLSRQETGRNLYKAIHYSWMNQYGFRTLARHKRSRAAV